MANCLVCGEEIKFFSRATGGICAECWQRPGIDLSQRLTGSARQCPQCKSTQVRKARAEEYIRAGVRADVRDRGADLWFGNPPRTCADCKYVWIPTSANRRLLIQQYVAFTLGGIFWLIACGLLFDRNAGGKEVLQATLLASVASVWGLSARRRRKRQKMQEQGKVESRESAIIACPKCAKRLRIGDRPAGKKVKCGNCQAVFVVPPLSHSGDINHILP